MSAVTNPIPQLAQTSRLYINKLETSLRSSDFFSVYESLSKSTDFTFHGSTIFHQHALRTYIGERERSSGVKVPVWAYILPEEIAMKPPIVFREEPVNEGEQGTKWPRSASSLLRKAQDLLPPFPLLQFHPSEGTRGVRGMVCALVAYYALISGTNDCSMQWDEFETSFIAALEHIRMNAEIQGDQEQHADEQPSLAATRNVSALSSDTVAGTKRSFSDFASNCGDVETASQQPQHDAEKQGGTVRAAIGAIQVKSQTSLERYIGRMGNKSELLDNIPDTPVQISRQSLYPSYWPYRLHIGTHPSARSSDPGFDVFVYYTRQKSRTMVLHGHDAGVERTWVSDRLAHIDLFEPFSQLRGSASNRGNKVRYLVQYYFAVAANEGLIEEPPTNIPRGSRDFFISLCKDLAGEEGPSGDAKRPRGYDGAEQISKSPSSMLQSGKIACLVVRLKLGGHDLAVFSGTAHNGDEDTDITHEESEKDDNDMAIEDEIEAADVDIDSKQSRRDDHIP